MNNVRVSIPDPVLVTLSRAGFAREVDAVSNATTLAGVTAAERNLALAVREAERSNTPSVFFLSVADMLDLMSCIHGHPFGAHALWLDRNDVATLLNRSPQHISHLVRDGETFDVLLRPWNQRTTVKAWISADSAESANLPGKGRPGEKRS